MGQEEYNQQYDVTVAKGLCFECGVNPVQVTTVGRERVESIWCTECKLRFGWESGVVSEAVN